MTRYAQLPAQCLSLAASAPGSVLLQTSRPDSENYRSYLFLRPTRILPAGAGMFDEIEEALASGAYVAGYLSYECGEGLRGLNGGEARENQQQDNYPRSAPELRARDLGHQVAEPLAWFGVYSEAFIFDHRTGEFEGWAPDDLTPDFLPSRQRFEISNLRLGIDESSYAQRIAAIQEYIRSGDTYQVNFTDWLDFAFCGSPEAMFAALGQSQPVAYSVYVHGGDWQILSFSPELFFRVNGPQIVTRPMKGTARRGADAEEDARIARWLHDDAKNRSENVMIVDLLRNDLGRICEYGSVRAEKLFVVERYETLFQMTSEVTGTLREDVGYREIFESLFPCGSVTGAPKHRTMQIIEELERGPRGVYTGAIGFFSPAGEAVFNVPIRTVVLQANKGRMGVGSGIVIDSAAEQEYRECLLKAEFLTAGEEPLQLIESLRWEDGFPHLAAHLVRLQASAEYFGFEFERAAVIAALEQESARLPRGGPHKVRLLLARSGEVSITHSLLEAQVGGGKVIISECRVCSADRFLRHKTTRRERFDQEYARARELGYDEVLFLNERGEVTEGAITNVFVEKDGQWFTPPLSCGLLPGVYRRHLLETRNAIEQVLRVEDLIAADAVYICNAVRGCWKVKIDAKAGSTATATTALLPKDGRDGAPS